MGRLTRDPEVRYTTNNNTLVCSFSLAVNRRFRQEGQPDADFINIVAWAKTGEFCSKYFTKGQQVAVSGHLQTRSYDDKDGNKKYSTEVIAEKVTFLSSKKLEE
jgi:single-strand DNA-binding protein